MSRDIQIKNTLLIMNGNLKMNKPKKKKKNPQWLRLFTLISLCCEVQVLTIKINLEDTLWTVGLLRK